MADSRSPAPLSAAADGSFNTADPFIQAPTLMAIKYLVLSCSLNPDSNSRVMAQAALERLRRAGAAVDFLDLADLPLPFCDGAAAYADPNARLLKERLRAAHGILLATPIYNYDVNAAAKNVVELTGRDGWQGKVAAFLCAAGGKGSYMSVMSLASSLMLDFRTVIVPRFVYASEECFAGGRIADEDLNRRLDDIARDLVRFTEALTTFD